MNRKTLNPGLVALAALLVGTMAYADASSSSWQDITSKHGQCRVLMPDKTTKTRQESGSHQTTTYIGTADGITYELAYTVYTSEYLRRKARTRLLKEAIQLTVSTMLGKVTTEKTFDFQGNEAIAFDFEGIQPGKAGAAENRQRARGRGRAIWANGIEYVLTCKGSEPETNSDCSKFLDSFKINTVQAEPAK
jgi:hypothetical protein